jgi:hypothetical protein
MKMFAWLYPTKLNVEVVQILFKRKNVKTPSVTRNKAGKIAHVVFLWVARPNTSLWQLKPFVVECGFYLSSEGERRARLSAKSLGYESGICERVIPTTV